MVGSPGALWHAVLRLRIRWLLAIGVILRLILVPFFSLTYDVSVWSFLTDDMLKGLSIYASHTFTYPPLWAYTILPLTRILAFLVNPNTLSQFPDNLAPLIQPGTLQPIVSPLFLTIIKLPLLLTDLAGAYLIYKIASEFTTHERAKAALTLWLLNPAIIWTSYGQGQFDTIPAVLTLAASYLILRRHPASTGIALSLSILYKLYPLFLIPLYLVLLFAPHTRDAGRNRLRDLLRFTAGLLAPAIIFLLIPILIPINGNGGFIQALTSRGGLIASIGGFSPFSILNLSSLYNLKQLVVLHSSTINIIILSFEAALSVFIAGLMRRQAASDLVKANLHGHILILAMLLLTLPLTTPQYFIWIMPFLILSYAHFGEFCKRTWILGVVGFLFNPISFGPGYSLYPAAAYLGVPTIASIVSFDSAFAPLAFVSLFLCQSIGFATILSLLKPDLNLSRHIPPRSPIPVRPQMNLSPKLQRRIKTTLTLTTLFLIASLAFTTINTNPAITQSPGLTTTCCKGTYNSTFVNAQATLHLIGGTYPSEVDAILLPLKSISSQARVYIYYDPAYPPILTELRGWIGLIDHLPFELGQRGYYDQTICPQCAQSLIRYLRLPYPTYTVNATELARLINTNASATIIMPSGILPYTVSIAALKGWLANGGTLFWLGDRIGYSSCCLLSTPPGISGYAAQKLLFNGIILSSNTTNLDTDPAKGTPSYQAGTMVTLLSRELNLNYPETIVGANLQNLTKLGGTALGRINPQTNQTSIALVPIGKGHLILFGGGITHEFTTSGEMTVAADIAQIIAGGFQDAIFQSAFRAEILAPGQSVSTNLTLTQTVSAPIVGVLLVAYSPDPYVSFFTESIYPPPA